MVAVAEPSYKARPTRQQTHRPKKPDEEASMLHTPCAAVYLQAVLEIKQTIELALWESTELGIFPTKPHVEA